MGQLHPNNIGEKKKSNRFLRASTSACLGKMCSSDTCKPVTQWRVTKHRSACHLELRLLMQGRVTHTGKGKDWKYSATTVQGHISFP